MTRRKSGWGRGVVLALLAAASLVLFPLIAAGAIDCTGQPGGTPCADDGNDCTNDVCDGSGTCVYPNLAGGTLCADDGNDCTNDVCDGSGTCVHPNIAGGTP